MLDNKDYHFRNCYIEKIRYITQPPLYIIFLYIITYAIEVNVLIFIHRLMEIIYYKSILPI